MTPTVLSVISPLVDDAKSTLLETVNTVLSVWTKRKLLEL